MFHSPLLSFVLYRRKTSLALLLPTDCSWSILQDLQQLSHHGVQLGLVERKEARQSVQRTYGSKILYVSADAINASDTSGSASAITRTHIWISARKVKNAKDDAASGPGGPGSRATGSTIVETSGTVTVDGPNPSAYSKSIADRQAGADAEAGPDGAKSNGSSSGYAYTNAGGSTSNSNPWTINNSPQNQQSLLYS
ncbi:hypothetical protein Bca52824_060240 [Brassica carinata]|uniref:Uncharacterized protein n=1 Tax=Brassica carinata TaxID=52824 RepID=A0A8X7QVZ8_BRACI|nr:hypothetical protein Bca52824_060240 [Brassica carinata]